MWKKTVSIVMTVILAIAESAFVAGMIYDNNESLHTLFTTEKEESVIAVTKPSKVKGVTVESTVAKQAVVAWNKVENANGYQVTYSTSKKFVRHSTKAKLIDKGKTTKTTLKKLKSGKKYFIKVRAYKTFNEKMIYGAFSKTVNVKVKSNIDKITDGDIVNSNGKITDGDVETTVTVPSTEKITTTGVAEKEKTTASSTTIKEDIKTTIVYVVNNIYVPVSDTEKSPPAPKATKPAKVKIKKPTSKKKKQISVNWNVVKDANGYQVAYSTSKKFAKKTTKTKIIKSVKTTKTTLKKLKSGKKYFIRVRAYKTVNNKKLYGAYSKVMNVKVK